MKFFFDESGSFRVSPLRHAHRVGVVVGVVVPDRSQSDLFGDFEKFVASLPLAEKRNGEPKGHLLSAKSLESFCEFLSRHKWVTVVPTTLDLSDAVITGLDRFPVKMEHALLGMIHDWPEGEDRDSIGMLAARFRNLSVNQAIRLYSWAAAIKETLWTAALFMSHGENSEEWHSLEIQIDRTQKSAASREWRVFTQLWGEWLHAWSLKDPIKLVHEWHTPDLPIRRLYDRGPGLDVRAMFNDKIRWVDSRQVLGVQIADMASYIVFRAATDLDDKNGMLTLLSSLLGSSFNGPTNAIGLFYPEEEIPRHIRQKYVPIRRFLERGGNPGGLIMIPRPNEQILIARPRGFPSKSSDSAS